MSNEHLVSADQRRREGAAALGKALLGGLRGVGVGSGAMGKALMAGHVHAAQRAAVNDFHRVANSPLAHGRTEALSKAASILDETVQIERLPRGAVRSELEKRLEAAADGFQRPAPVRERNPNAGTLPRGAFEPNEIRGPEARTGFEYPADEPANPMERLFGPAVNGRRMNWPSVDSAAPREARHEGRGGPYDASEPGKAAAAYSPSESLLSIAKRQSERVPLAKSLDLAFEHRAALGESLYRDYVAMRSHIADSPRPANWKTSEEYRDLVGRIDRAAVSSFVKGELLSALA